MTQNLSILGSTGSIGTQTLDVCRMHGINVVCLTANSNVDLLEKQIREFRPELACLMNEAAAKDLKARLSGIEIQITYGMEGLISVATYYKADTVVTAVVGMIGVQPTIAAIKAKKTIALANKETLVTAGHIIMPLAKDIGVSILPVDSEHSAIFQSLNGERHNKISKILLTASGGPFRGRSLEDLENVKLEDALKHPNWDMGPKVTIDSSTLVNKGLELMEAHWLFDVGYDDIEVLVHPESIVHSAVQYTDGAVIAQLGIPDMHLPIQYALFYPHRMPLNKKRLDLSQTANLHFEKPDIDTFKGLKLAFRAARTGGSLPTVFNASNELAVRHFLKGEIKYLEIAEEIEKAKIGRAHV